MKIGKELVEKQKSNRRGGEMRENEDVSYYN